MRVTFVLPHAGRAGGVRVVAHIADELRRFGHEVVMVSTRHQPPSLRDRAKSLLLPGRRPVFKKDGSHVDDFPLHHVVLDHSGPVTARDVPDADVIVATWWETAEWVSRLPPSKGQHFYFIQQYEANFGSPAARVDATWKLPMGLIACSKWLADFGRSKFGRADITVVPNGVDCNLFNAAGRGKQPVPTLGFMYSSVGLKRFDLVREVVELVRKDVPELRCISFGHREPGIGDPPLPKNTVFVAQPAQGLLRCLYSSCDVWLCCSDSEGFHLPPHEAMACRCPVVSTRVGGPMDMISEGVEGYLAEPGDAPTLARRCIEVLALRDEEWRIMSQRAHSKALSFTWQSAAKLFEAALVEGEASPSGTGAGMSATELGTSSAHAIFSG